MFKHLCLNLGLNLSICWVASKCCWEHYEPMKPRVPTWSFCLCGPNVALGERRWGSRRGRLLQMPELLFIQRWFRGVTRVGGDVSRERCRRERRLLWKRCSWVCALVWDVGCEARPWSSTPGLCLSWSQDATCLQKCFQQRISWYSLTKPSNANWISTDPTSAPAARPAATTSDQPPPGLSRIGISSLRLENRGISIVSG